MLSTSGVAPISWMACVVGAVGEIEALEPVVGRGKPEPGFGVARMQLDGLAEMPLGQTVVALPEIILAEAEIVVGIVAEQLRRQRRRAAAGLCRVPATEPVTSPSAAWGGLTALPNFANGLSGKDVVSQPASHVRARSRQHQPNHTRTHHHHTPEVVKARPGWLRIYWPLRGGLTRWEPSRIGKKVFVDRVRRDPDAIGIGTERLHVADGCRSRHDDPIDAPK